MIKRFLIFVVCVVFLPILTFAIDCTLPTPTPQPNISRICIPEYSFICFGGRYIKVTVWEINSNGDKISDKEDLIPKSEWEGYLENIVPTGWTLERTLKNFFRLVLIDRGIIPPNITNNDISFGCDNCSF